MNSNNILSVVIPAAELTEIQNHVKELHDLLAPYVISLSTEQRKKLPKMGEKNTPFVQKALEYSKSNPEFAPKLFDTREFEIDLNAVADLKSILRPLAQIFSTIDDTSMLSGSEAWLAACRYYRSVQDAAKMNEPGAKEIAEDLGKRFVQASRKPDPIV